MQAKQSLYSVRYCATCASLEFRDNMKFPETLTIDLRGHKHLLTYLA